MNVMITGYGQMGQQIESFLIERGHTVTYRVDPAAGRGDIDAITPGACSESDMVIDFSYPGGIMSNIQTYIDNKLPAVIGTTGWQNNLAAVEEGVNKSGAPFLYGSNFSIGAHMFFKIIASASALMDKTDEYDAMMIEYHHKLKKDSPSGTALTAAKQVVENFKRKTSIVTERLDRQIEPHELHLSSVRGGNVPGTHSLHFDSLADTITITHQARSRKGFALGAVQAAEWLSERSSGFYNVEDFINDVFM